ncbi:MAG: S9 family peptidase [Sphingobacteriales bacterium]|nr:MAG: S9 family peptidase [Sphingobacteriales bacterium]
MKKIFLPLLLLGSHAWAQNKMTPEMLWSLKRVSAEGISEDGGSLYFASKQVDWKTEKSTTKHYVLDMGSGKAKETNAPHPKNIIQRKPAVWYAQQDEVLYMSSDKGKTWKKYYEGVKDADNIQVSPDGKWIAFSREVMVQPMNGTDIYKDLPKTTAQVYTDLNYRHWDTWEDGKYSHIFIMKLDGGEPKDIMANEPYDAPQKPFGGSEDFSWSPDGKGIVYVSKKKVGKEYATSTNTDLYYYDIAANSTTNWTVGMMGYDTQPVFNANGSKIAWTSMKRDGFEADKNDLYVMDLGDKKNVLKLNVTEDWDGTVEGFVWDKTGNKIYFNAPWKGTVQLFEVTIPTNTPTSKLKPVVRKITDGKFDVNGIVGLAGTEIVVSRTDMNHATELYGVNSVSGAMRQLTHENDDAYSKIKPSETELKMITTTDGQQMGVWVVYPPDFDVNKKYPTLLYCQGGPQSALSQFYSIRWNFQLMAAQGYIVVAPNRRGMPGWGAKWNEDISKDWGGQPMKDYLSAIDAVSKEKYVDKDRLGCVGASYGGYSVYMLAGMHNNRFKTFIAHDGLFDLKSWYGTTEELWFANWDIGGNYWQKDAPQSYAKFNPSNFVDKWTAPIMIVQGGIDYRVPVEQGLEAFQAAQLRGIKSKLLYLPNENHWVLHAQNGIAWQREFFKWLDETLK